MEEEENETKKKKNRYTNMCESACICACARVCVLVWYAEAQKKNVSTQLYKISVLSWLAAFWMG